MIGRAWFSALCWAVVVLGVVLACRGPKPPPPEFPTPEEAPPGHDFGEGSETDLVHLGVSLKGWAQEETIVTFRFSLNSATPLEPSRVSALARRLQRTSRTVRLDGHACPLGSAKYNLALSLRRAQAVRDALVAGGVAADRIAIVAHGEGRPLTLDPDRFAENRRVEVYLQ